MDKVEVEQGAIKVAKFVQTLVEKSLGLSLVEHNKILNSDTDSSAYKAHEKKVNAVITAPAFSVAETWNDLLVLYLAYIQTALPLVPTTEGPSNATSELKSVLKDIILNGAIPLGGDISEKTEFQEFLVNDQVTDVDKLSSVLSKANFKVHVSGEGGGFSSSSETFSDLFKSGGWKIEYGSQNVQKSSWSDVWGAIKSVSPQLKVKGSSVALFSVVNKNKYNEEILPVVAKALARAGQRSWGKGKLSAYDVERQCTIHGRKKDCITDPTCDWTPRGCIRTYGSRDQKMYKNENDDWLSALDIKQRCSSLNKKACDVDSACDWFGSKRGCARVKDNYYEPQYSGPFQPIDGWPEKSYSYEKGSEKTDWGL